VLGVLATLAADSHPLRRPWKLLLPAVLCLLYAAGDEFHQSFIPGRGPQIRDVCIDFAGALTGILLTRLFCSLWERRRRRKETGGNL
jgi:VanZ family protein